MNALGSIRRTVVIGSLFMTCAVFPPFARSAGSSLEQANSILQSVAHPEWERLTSRRARSPIVGMWIVTYYVGPFRGDDTPQFDRAIQQFSSDGNELMNSALFPPVVGNVCFGVWKDLGHDTFKLRHIGWTFTTANAFEGTFRLSVALTVGPGGDAFSGTYTSDVLGPDGKVLDGSAAEGDVIATRFEVEEGSALEARALSKAPSFPSPARRSGC